VTALGQTHTIKASASGVIDRGHTFAYFNVLPADITVHALYTDMVGTSGARDWYNTTVAVIVIEQNGVETALRCEHDNIRRTCGVEICFEFKAGDELRAKAYLNEPVAGGGDQPFNYILAYQVGGTCSS